MPKFAQVIMGPAGSGKSTYCSIMQEHLKACGRNCYVVNLDPAAEHFNYELTLDIRELIQLDDVMEDEELRFGPNGGLIFCMEYIVKNLDWLQENMQAAEEDYFIFDCPGQIELYTHLPVMKQLVSALQAWDFNICGLFLVDAQFLGEPSKFISGVLSSLSCMINLEISHLSIMTKVDLLPSSSKRQLEEYMDPDMNFIAENQMTSVMGGHQKYAKLNTVICDLINDYGLVKFLPLDRSDEGSIDVILQNIDMALQYGDETEVRTRDFDQDGPSQDTL